MKFIFLILFLVSCSNLSKSLVKVGDLTIHSGKAGSKEWSENLSFKRISWYKEMTLYFELMYTKIDETTPFYNWISESEKSFFRECNEAWIVMSYEHNPDIISQKMFLEQMDRQGLKKYVLNDFSRQLKMHPDYEQMSLVLHKVYGLCGKEKLDNLNIDFPGFQTIQL